MVNNLFVGGLPYETKREELEKMFATVGKVVNVKIIMDRETGKSKGFGFVEMSSEAEAKAAIEKLNGAQIGARQIFVKEARPPEKRVPGAAPRPSFGDRRPPTGPRPGGGFGDRGGGGGWPPSEGKRDSFGKDKERGRKWGKKSGGGGKWDDAPGGGRKGGRPDVEQEDQRSFKGGYQDDDGGLD